MPFQGFAADHGGDQPPQQPPPPKPETKVLSLLLKVLIMILLTTLFFVFLGLATALLLIHLCIASALHRRRRRHRRAQSPKSSSGLSPRDLKKLLQFPFSKWVKPHCQTDCAICLDGFRKGQWCRRLGACGHVYHRKCIDPWLVRISACPLCRSCVQLDVEEHQANHVSSQNYEILYAL